VKGVKAEEADQFNEHKDNNLRGEIDSNSVYNNQKEESKRPQKPGQQQQFPYKQ